MKTRSALAILIGVMACTGDGPRPFGDAVPGTITQAITEGGPNPAAIVVPLTNNGTCTLNFARTIQTVDGTAWLAVTPISGTIMPNTTTNLTISLDVVGPQLLPGTYTGTIVLTGTCATTGRAAAGSPLSIAVNLTVTPNLAGIATGDMSIEQDTTVLANAWSPVNATGQPAGEIGGVTVWSGSEVICGVSAG